MDYKKTEISVQMLSQEEDWLMYVESYSQLGFRLNTGVRIIGPCAVFPKSILHWNVKGAEDIHESSLCLFTLLEPKLDILIIGKGDRSSSVSPKLYTYLRSKKINVEILPTDQALATFNFLNSERRYVAGAFIPPEYTHTFRDEDAGMGEVLERVNIYEAKTDYHVPHHSVDDLEGWKEEYEKAKQNVATSFSGAKIRQSDKADSDSSEKDATSKKDKTGNLEKP
ncbi:NADH dehydrogenase [ubiquinone] 1 alpha subcomplex assembly factor 3-like isoform X2 [Liolophura sinensis]